MSSSRVQISFTGPSTCLAIRAACAMLSMSSRRPNAPPIIWLCTVTDCGRQAGRRRHRVLRAHRHLRADPDIGAVRPDMDRGVDRLHRRVRQERQLVDDVEALRRGLDRAGRVAFGFRDDALRSAMPHPARAMMPAVARSAFGPSSQTGAAAARPCFAAHMWSPITATASSRRTTSRTPGTRARRGLVDRRAACRRSPGWRRRCRSSCRAPGRRCRRPRVPLTLDGVSSRRWLRADQRELRRVLQRHVVRHRQQRRRVRQRAIAERCARSARASPWRARRGRRRRRRPTAPPPPRSAWCARPRRPRAAASSRRGWRWSRRSPARPAAGWHTAPRSGARLRAGSGRARPRAPRRSAWRRRSRCPGRIRCCAMISVIAPARSMRMKALGANGAAVLGGAAAAGQAQPEQQTAAHGEAGLQTPCAAAIIGHLRPPPRHGWRRGCAHRCRSGRCCPPSRRRYRRRSASAPCSAARSPT